MSGRRDTTPLMFYDYATPQNPPYPLMMDERTKALFYDSMLMNNQYPPRPLSCLDRQGTNGYSSPTKDKASWFTHVTVVFVFA